MLEVVLVTVHVGGLRMVSTILKFCFSIIVGIYTMCVLLLTVGINNIFPAAICLHSMIPMLGVIGKNSCINGLLGDSSACEDLFGT